METRTPGLKTVPWWFNFDPYPNRNPSNKCFNPGPRDLIHIKLWSGPRGTIHTRCPCGNMCTIDMYQRNAHPQLARLLSTWCKVLRLFRNSNLHLLKSPGKHKRGNGRIGATILKFAHNHRIWAAKARQTHKHTPMGQRMVSMAKAATKHENEEGEKKNSRHVQIRMLKRYIPGRQTKHLRCMQDNHCD